MSELLTPIARRVRAGDPDRFLVTLFAPAEARPALLALAALDLELHRIERVTTQPMAGLIRLQWWRESLDGIEASRPRAHPLRGSSNGIGFKGHLRVRGCPLS